MVSMLVSRANSRNRVVSEVCGGVVSDGVKRTISYLRVNISPSSVGDGPLVSQTLQLTTAKY